MSERRNGRARDFVEAVPHVPARADAIDAAIATFARRESLSFSQVYSFILPMFLFFACKIN